MFAVDLDLLVITQSVVARTALARVTFVTRNNRRVPVQFFRPSLVGAVELATGSTGQILIKKQGTPAAGALARALTWTKEGSGTGTVYWFELNLFTDELNTAFAENPESLSDLVLEITFVENANVQTAPAIPCTIWNRYLQSDEDEPTPADPDMPAAADILVKIAQTLTEGEKTQAQTNLGLVSMMFRAPVAAEPTAFDDAGALGDYHFAAASGKLWTHTGTQWVYARFISE